MEKHGRAEEVDTAATGIKEDPTKVTIDLRGTAEEVDIEATGTEKDLEDYKQFVKDLQKEYNLSPEEAHELAQKLIKEREARRSAMMEGKGRGF